MTRCTPLDVYPPEHLVPRANKPQSVPSSNFSFHLLLLFGAMYGPKLKHFNNRGSAFRWGVAVLLCVSVQHERQLKLTAHIVLFYGLCVRTTMLLLLLLLLLLM
jgi:hypothetical protein